MSKSSLRLSEKWYRRGLWVVAYFFASFLIGLGSTVVGDLPKVEQSVTIENYMDKNAASAQRAIIEQMRLKQRQAQVELDQAQLKWRSSQADAQSAQQTFENWLATRSVTERSEQDPEVISRNRNLDALKTAERLALSNVQAEQQALLTAQQASQSAQNQLTDILRAGDAPLKEATRSQELRVFLYRLALTLPLLAIAGWLFAKKRKSIYWPFVWGFIIFAVSSFFVELVPYIPSWGGWVRYVVGIVVTVLVGRYGIEAMNKYLEGQREAEKLTDAQRRKELSYDVALERLAKGVCPGCERPVDLKDVAINYCPHCSICLHNHCTACETRKSAFSKFCHSCGASSVVSSATTSAPVTTETSTRIA